MLQNARGYSFYRFSVIKKKSTGWWVNYSQRLPRLGLKQSPRAYVRYTYHKDKIPNPKPLIEGMNYIFFFEKKRLFNLTYS